MCLELYGESHTYDLRGQDTVLDLFRSFNILSRCLLAYIVSPNLAQTAKEREISQELLELDHLSSEVSEPILC